MEIEPQPDYQFSEATAADATEIRTLHAASWMATYPSEENGVPHEWVKDRTDKWLSPESLKRSEEVIGNSVSDPNQAYRVAKLNGKIVGFVHISNKEDETVYLDALYTDPNTFGTGLGAQLMKLAVQLAEGAEMSLDVAAYNARAIRFYEKNGFRIVEGSESVFAERIPTVIMKREGVQK